MIIVVALPVLRLGVLVNFTLNMKVAGRTLFSGCPLIQWYTNLVVPGKAESQCFRHTPNFCYVRSKTTRDAVISKDWNHNQLEENRRPGLEHRVTERLYIHS